jgi:hypothetical protein
MGTCRSYYGLNGPGIESRWVGETLRTCPDRPWGPPSLLYNWYRVLPGGKERPGRDSDPSPSFSAVGHERVELYLYSPYGPYGLYRASVSVQGCTLPLHVEVPVLFYCLWKWLLQKIFGPKGDEGTEEWRKLHSEKLCDLFCSPNIQVMK